MDKATPLPLGLIRFVVIISSGTIGAFVVIYVTLLFERHLVLWPAWIIITLVAICTGVVRKVSQAKITWSINELLLIVTWAGFSCAIYSISRGDLAESSFREAVNKLIAWNGSLTKARDYSEHLVVPITASERLVVPLTNDVTELSDQIQQYYEQVDTAAQKLLQMPVQTKTARRLLLEQKRRGKLLNQLQQTAKEIQTISVTAGNEEFDTHGWYEQTKKLQAAELKLQQQLQTIENAHLFALPLSMGKPANEATRLAAFEILRWPGLTDQQFQEVQRHVDQEPFIAQVLLIDYAIRNAQ